MDILSREAKQKIIKVTSLEKGRKKQEAILMHLNLDAVSCCCVKVENNILAVLARHWNEVKQYNGKDIFIIITAILFVTG